jgi:hypothetical protein
MDGSRATGGAEACGCHGEGADRPGRGRRVARRLEGVAYRILREPGFVALSLFKRLATRRERP